MAHVAVLSQKRQTVFFHWFDSYYNSLWPTTATSLLSNPHMAPIRKLFLAVCNLFQNLITGFASDRHSGFIWMEHVSTNTKQQLYGLTLFTQTPHHPNWPSVRACGFMCVRMSMRVGRFAFLLWKRDCRHVHNSPVIANVSKWRASKANSGTLWIQWLWR